MKIPVQVEAVDSSSDTHQTCRRSFLKKATVMGAVTGVAAFDGLLGMASARDRDDDDKGHDRDDRNAKQRDTDILIAAEIAEALAVTTTQT